jgi:major vault protein
LTKAETIRARFTLQQETTERKLVFDLANIKAAVTTQEAINSQEEARHDNEANARRDAEDLEGELAALKLARQIAISNADIDLAKQRLELKLQEIKAECESAVAKAGAISPDLIAAMSAFGERGMIEKVASSMAPLSIIGGSSVIDVAKQLLQGTPMLKQLEALDLPKDGAAKKR